MKEFLFVLTLTCFCFASGGDTITYTDDVKNLADGEPFYSDIHYHSMKDSIAKVVNGNLGNNNIASDAEIDLSKLDTTGILRGDTLRNKKVNTDTVKTKVATADSTNSTAIKTTRVTADSVTIPVLKGAKTIRDTTTFTGGAYFAGIARFAGTLYAPVVYIDSMKGDVKIGGNIYQTGTIFQLTRDLTTDVTFTISPDNDGVALTTGGIRRLRIYTGGAENFIFDSTGNFTATTFNTGNGDCEVYQVTKGTTLCSLYVDGTFNLAGTIKYTTVDSVVNIRFPVFTANQTGSFVISTLPTAIRPSVAQSFIVYVVYGGTNTTGMIRVNTDGTCSLLRDNGGSFNLAGENGLVNSTTITITR